MISWMSRGSAEFISLMYRTALSWSLQCTGQRWVDIYNVQNSADFFSTSIVWICTYLRVVIRKFHWILNNLRKYSVYELHKMCLTMYIYKGTVSQTYRILEFFLFIMAWQRGFWNLFRLTEPSYLFVKHPKHFFKISSAQLIERCPLLLYTVQYRYLDMVLFICFCYTFTIWFLVVSFFILLFSLGKYWKY